MAGSVVTTQAVITAGIHDVVGSVTHGLRAVVNTSMAWTSDASGNVSANTVMMSSGTILLVKFIPGLGGVQPTNLYDVSFTDSDGVNVFDDGSGSSIGANLSNATPINKCAFVGSSVAGLSVTFVRQWIPGGLHTLVVSGAGNAKQGTVKIYQCLDAI